uniref:Uncharacterized protein n=1 Tax=Mola mola TaxID=94237 RepID=A0A3Q3WGS5_MOLML
MWSFVYLMMLPVRKMTPRAASASKIKNKILNTSSFFKVSLKTNNTALARALEAQKERSRQLEQEVAYLQKQIEALCFELAIKKYKHRKMVGLLISTSFTLPSPALPPVFWSVPPSPSHTTLLVSLPFCKPFFFPLLLLLICHRSLLKFFSIHSTLPALTSSPLFHTPRCSEQLIPTI